MRKSLQALAIGFTAALFVAIVSAQTPAEKSMYVDTPAGWKAPKTAWGDPDLQGTWPISYVGSVPLERCQGFGGRGGTPPPPCDQQKPFLTESEYRERLAAAAGRSDRYADAIKSGNFGGAFQAGVTDPTVTQR